MGLKHRNDLKKSFLTALRLCSILLLLQAAAATSVRAASLTIDSGVTVRAGSEGRLIVRDTLHADKATLTCGSTTPAPGNWLGLLVLGSATSTLFNGTVIECADTALEIRGNAPQINYIEIRNNTAGIKLMEGSSPTINKAVISGNTTGVEAGGGAKPVIQNSWLAGNTVAVRNLDAGQVLSAANNWWGHPTGPLDPSDDRASGGFFNPAGLGSPVSDVVNYAPWSALIPIIGASFSIAQGSVTETTDITLDLSCLTCTEFRASESSSFPGAPFQSLVPQFSFPLSSGDGMKTVYVQFRTGTGNSSTTYSDAIRLDTAGPALAVAGPEAGAVVARPVTVEASATDPAGVAKVEFSVDDVLAASKTGDYRFAWDVRAATDGGHELKVVAYDTLGHTTTDIRTVTVGKTPPAAPSITAPTAGTINATSVDVSGLAEPNISVTLYANGAYAGKTVADASGAFALSAVALPEGANRLTAAASDSLGSSQQSAAILVNVDTGSPAAPRFYSAVAGSGGSIKLNWVPDAGELPTGYKLYRATASFTSPAEATLVNGSITENSFTDLPAADGTYYYAVSAMDAAGNESPLSALITAASDRTPPTAAVVFNPVSPVGPGNVAVTLTLSEPLAVPPYLGITPAGAVSSVIDLVKVTETEWTGTFPVTGSTPNGMAALVFAGRDLMGNKGSQITSGSSLLIDTAGPSGALQLSPASSFFKPGNVAVTLTLDEAAASAPALQFIDPSASTTAIPLTGSGTTWTGTLTITSGMGDGTGHFTLVVVDAFGNSGSSLGAGSTIVLDVTTPAAPQGLTAVAQPGGHVRLAWTPLSDATSYRVYRGAAAITLPADPLATGVVSGIYLDLPDSDGIYHYTVTAVDRAGNESSLSGDVSAASDRTAPNAPVGLGQTLAGTAVQLSWNAPAGEPAASYRLYRATAPIVTVSGLSSLQTVTSATAAADTPAEDGTYYYAVTALDSAGNESAPSDGTSLVYNLSPPVITVAGVSDGQFSAAQVVPAVTVTSASLANQTLLLDGQPFTSGTAVSWEGAHVLHIEATDTSARTTVKEIAFTIDLTDPEVTVSNVSEGTLYELAVSPTVTANDANLDKTVITLNGAPYASGTAITTDGAKALRVEATDRAGRKKILIVNFTLDTAPQLPASYTVTATQGGSAVLSWTASPAADVAGYYVYKSNTRLTNSLVSALTYTDAFFDGNSLQSYALSAVDSAGHESGRLTANVQPLRISVKSYGRAYGSGSILSKQFIESIVADVANTSGSAVEIGSLSCELRDHVGTVAERLETGPITLQAGETISKEKILPVGNGIVDYRLYDVTLTLTADPNVTVKRVAGFELNAFDPGRKIEMFNDPIIKGGTARVRMKIFNHGSVPIELLTSSGDKPSPDIYILLKDGDGNVLAKGNLNQKGVGVINYSGYSLAEVPAGGSFLSDPVEFVVPSSAPDTVKLEAHVKNLYYHYNKFDQIVAGDFKGYSTVSVSQPAYIATISSDHQVYDQNTPVILTGSAFDTATGLKVPDAAIKIGISVKGFDRSLAAVTDSAGNYTATFTPLNGEAGTYSIWATHPAVSDKPIQAGFSIYGLAFDPRSVDLRMSKNSSFTMPVTIRNQGETALNNISFTVAGGAGMTGTVDTTGSVTRLEGGKTTTVKLTLNASAGAPDASSATLTVTNAEGITRALEVNIALLPALPGISTDPAYVSVGVNRNSSKVVTVKLKNVGNAALENIVIQPPSLPWIGLLTSTTVPNLQPGETADITVNFRPTDSVAQGPQADKLVITSGNHVPYTLNLFATVASTNKGSVHFQATDSLNKRVADASVVISHQQLGSVILSGKTDANGEISFPDITEGMYNYKVQAQGHEIVIGTFEVIPDTVTPLEIFMNNVFVTYEWSVTPVTIRDNYDVKLVATFETQVPAPVLTIDPSYEKLEIEIGSTYVGEYRVTNHGLVAADNVKIGSTYAPGLRVDVLVTELPRIGPQETVIIPYRITVNPFKSPTPVEGCSKLPMEVNVGGGYYCAFGTLMGTGVTGKKTIIPRDRDFLGLCDVECDWCKCIPYPPAASLCSCIKELSEKAAGDYKARQEAVCTCLGMFGHDVADLACECMKADASWELKDVLMCVQKITGDAVLSAMKKAVDLLDAFKGGLACGLCLGELIPGFPPSSGASYVSGGTLGGGYGGMGTGGPVGIGFSGAGCR